MARTPQQEFIVNAWRPAGNVPRDENTTHQDEEHTVVYSRGGGENIDQRMRNAVRRARAVMKPAGWDRYMATLTIADQEKRDSTLEREFDEQRLKLMEQQDDS